MPSPQIAPYGTWKSPITSDLIVKETTGLGQITLNRHGVYWLEMRPWEGGRNVVIHRTPEGQTREVFDPPYNARSRVHEYGGGAYAVMGKTVLFSNFSDQRLYRTDPNFDPRPLTPPEALRYADGVVDLRWDRLICVREDHTIEGLEAANSLVGVNLQNFVPLAGGESLEEHDRGRILAAGRDFYASPRQSPDGTQLAWVEWDHPNMPWDGTELWVAGFRSDGTLEKRQQVAGGQEESVLQPKWSPNGALHFISDRSGWWNLYRLQEGEVEALCPMEAEFAGPQWVFGLSNYDFETSGRIICTYEQDGAGYLARLDTATGRLEPLDLPYTAFGQVRVRGEQAVFWAGSPTEHPAIVSLDLASGEATVVRRSADLAIDAAYLSRPEAIEFPTEDGQTAHAFYYAPHNQEYQGPADERPPLVVMSHGGPTGATSNVLDLRIQYWTSRGFAVLDVNYRGSTGYGRDYRQQLNGRWGIVDVDDCVNGARYLVGRGLVDSERLAIRGGSAGGYTTLAALTFRDFFAVGASYYGVSDLEALAKETHKFESRYLDSMVGAYPERQDLYLARSPIHHTDRLSCPTIFFQGLEDRVVPPNQAERMVEALRAKGVPVAYVAFPGEQHGFRRAENIKRALDGELYFYATIFGFEPADPVEPVPVENLG